MRGLEMYRNALIRGFIGVSAGVGLAIPCFGRGHAPARPVPKLAITDYATTPAAGAPAADHELTSVEIKQLKNSRKQAEALYQNGLKYEKAGDLKNAQISYYKAIVLRQKLYGKGDSGIYILTNRLGDIGLKQKDWEYADKCFKELMKSQNKAHGPGDYDTVPILLKLSQVEQGRKAIPAQIDYLERALTLQERKVGPNAPECLATRLRLISATIEDGDWRDGDERLKRAMEIENGKGKTITREYLQLLKDGSKIMVGLNKPNDAAEFDRKAADLEAELPPPKAPTAATKPAAPAGAKAPAAATKPAGAKAPATKPVAAKGAKAPTAATKPATPAEAKAPAPAAATKPAAPAAEAKSPAPAQTSQPAAAPTPAVTPAPAASTATPDVKAATTSDKAPDLAPSPETKTK
jgi:tetratricopeptide (TPR) repeat protein